MRANGEPIRESLTTYKEYLDDLFAKRRETADELILKLPHLNPEVANGSITYLYEELKESFALGIPGASIVLSILLLELAARLRLYKERKALDPNTLWEPIEDMHLRETILELRDFGAITDKEEAELLEFNKNVRNNYLHYNIQKLVKEMVLLELPSANFETGEVKVEYNVRPYERPELWFSAKKVLDRESLLIRVGFCIDFVNKIINRETISPQRSRKKQSSFPANALKSFINRLIQLLRKIEKKL